MTKNRLLILALLLLCTTIQGYSQQISQRLDNYLTSATSGLENEFIPILIQLDHSIDLLDKSEDPLSEKTKRVLQNLQLQANNSQQILIAELERGIAEGLVESYQSHWIVNLVEAKIKPAYIQSLQNVSELRYLDLDVVLEFESVEDELVASAAENSTESGLKIINAHRLWELGITGQGRIMMNIDTGVDKEHPALSGTWRGNSVPADQAWLDQTFSPSVEPTDCNSHGSHVMGIMGGLDPNTNDTIGVAFGAEWIASKGICGGAGTRISKHIASFEWGMNPDGNLNTTDDMPDVISNSWYDPSSAYCNPIYEELFSNVEAVGVAIVFSAGNSGSGAQTITTPKNINLSLVNSFATGNLVGDDYLNGSLTPINFSSSRGPSQCGGVGSLLIKPEVCAPGTSIRSSVLNGEYGFKTGTSMAAPHVAGAIVLLKQAYPNLTGETIKLALYYTAIDLGDAGEDNTYGNGLIDVYAAYQYLGLLCENNIIVINDDIGVDTTFTASESITANAKISSGAAVTFRAGSEILLQDGFHAEPTSYFEAIIESCAIPANLINTHVASNNAKNHQVLDTAISREINSDLNKITIYPNPVFNELSVRNDQAEDLPYAVMIVDINGRLMFYKEDNHTEEIQIATESWPSGFYFARIQNNVGSQTFKIVKN